LIFPVVYFVIPFTALIQDLYLRYTVFLILIFIKGCVVIIGFPCSTILLTNSASSLHILGTLNGFATSFSGFGRAVGPALVGSVFTLGVRKGYMIYPWWLLAAIALVGAIPSWWIVEGPGPSRASDSDSDDDDLSDDGGEPNVDDEDDEFGPFASTSTSQAEQVHGSTTEFGVPEVLDEAIDLDDCLPMPGAAVVLDDSSTSIIPKPPQQVRLRRLSTAGQDLEHK
jgi:MFS family permease